MRKEELGRGLYRMSVPGRRNSSMFPGLEERESMCRKSPQCLECKALVMWAHIKQSLVTQERDLGFTLGAVGMTYADMCLESFY